MQIIHSRNNALSTNVVNTVLSTKKSPNYYNYPYIDSQSFNMAMVNYCQKVFEYNSWVEKENKAVKTYNNLVAAQLEATPPTDELLVTVGKFLKSIATLPVKHYNSSVDAFNKKHTPLATKKPTVTIKPVTEMIFRVILVFYTQQLKQRNLTRMQLGQSCAGTLPQVQLNSYEIGMHKLNEIPRLNMNKRTIQRHLKRLLEAEILVGYVFRGTKRPTLAYINNEILLVKDSQENLKTFTENQPFNLLPTTSCRNINHNTSTKINNIKTREVNNLPVANFNNNRPTSEGDVMSQGEATQSPKYENTKKGKRNFESSQKFNANSEFLKQRIQEQNKLAAEISSKKHTNTPTLPVNVLQQEASSGTLSREEFKTLLIQDFFIYSSKLWANSTPYAGSFIKAMRMFEDNEFQSPNGSVYHKDTMLKSMIKYRWMVERASSWLKNHGKYTLYPHLYFDFTRTEKHEGGFWHWSKRYDSQQARKKTAQNNKVSQVAKGKARKSDHRKAVSAINKYLNDKMNLTELQEYISVNLPNKFTKKLAVMINQANQKRFN